MVEHLDGGTEYGRELADHGAEKAIFAVVKRLTPQKYRNSSYGTSTTYTIIRHYLYRADSGNLVSCLLPAASIGW
jgi:hypothetical protein